MKNSKQRLSDDLRNSNAYDGGKDLFFFNWDGQKKYLLELSFKLYCSSLKLDELTPKESIKLTHDFLEVYREDVLSKRKLYYNY